MRKRSIPPSPAANAKIEIAAADWLAGLDRGLSPEEARRFATWRDADTRHAAELARLQAAWHLLDTAREMPEMVQLADSLEVQNRPKNDTHRVQTWVYSIAGLGVAAALMLAWTTFNKAPASVVAADQTPVAEGEARSYRVVPSAAQQLKLGDGTLVELNADSKVTTAFSASERRVRILRGEAHFAVAKDAARPFVVQVGNVTVRAVGTAFNVRVDSSAVELLVTEGKVRVDDAIKGETLLVRDDNAGRSVSAEPAILSAGQRVVVSAGDPAPAAPVPATAADIDRLLAWRSPQLVFERTPLDETVAAFNSFNRRQLVLAEPSMRNRRLGGTFRADNVDAFVRLLEKGFNIVAVQRDGQDLVLQPADSELRN